MSALPPKADMDRRDGNVRLVPKADICIAGDFLIRSPHWPLFAERNVMERRL